MESLTHYIQSFAGSVEVHEHDIFLASALIATLIALVMLIPRYDALAVGAWVKCFGWAFACFAAQYAVKWTAWALGFSDSKFTLLLLTLSIANTILFFASALYLLDKKPLWIWSIGGSILIVLLLTRLIKDSDY